MFTRLSMNCSPSLVPPPALLKNDRPSSALRALSWFIIRLTMLPTVVGSMTTVQRPGSTARGLCDRIAFSTATAPNALVSRSSKSCALVPAHPEPVPSGVRTVVVKFTRVLVPYAKSPLVVATAVLAA